MPKCHDIKSLKLQQPDPTLPALLSPRPSLQFPTDSEVFKLVAVVVEQAMRELEQIQGSMVDLSAWCESLDKSFRNIGRYIRGKWVICFVVGLVANS